MLQKIKQKIKIYKIKKEAMQPKAPVATMEDVQRKLVAYKPTRPGSATLR